MSDTAINQIVQYGTAAQRVAFTPDPPLIAGNPVQTLYIWYETDNAPDTYVWDGSAWVLINSGGVSGITELTGDVTAGPGSGSQAATIANNAVTTAKIANSNVTLAKIANIATDRLLGRDTAAAGEGGDYSVILGKERICLISRITSRESHNTNYSWVVNEFLIEVCLCWKREFEHDVLITAQA